jgi:hypothetical protein
MSHWTVIQQEHQDSVLILSVMFWSKKSAITFLGRISGIAFKNYEIT